LGEEIENEMGGACRAYGKRGVYWVLVRKPEGTRPLGRPRRRWEDNIKTYLQIEGCGGMDGLSWLRIETRGGQM
jgi:hypothetical protein